MAQALKAINPGSSNLHMPGTASAELFELTEDFLDSAHRELKAALQSIEEARNHLQSTKRNA